MFFKVAQKEMGYLGSFSNKIGHQEQQKSPNPVQGSNP